MKKIVFFLTFKILIFSLCSQAKMGLNTIEMKPYLKDMETKTTVPKILNASPLPSNSFEKLSSQFVVKQKGAEIFFDSDGDGVFDNIDIDDDNDGIKDTDEENSCRNSPIATIQTFCDTDGDGVPNIFDLDSDNDGIPDVVECGLGQFSNGTAKISSGIWIDSNGNGMHDAVEDNIPLDNDADGIPNYLDLDSDNDSIFDVDESGAGNINAVIGYENGDGDINGDGVGDGMDTDYFGDTDIDSDGNFEHFTDGIIDSFDYFNGMTFSAGYGNLNQGIAGIGWKDYVKDTDNDGIPDYLDTKSDGTTFDIAGTLYANLDLSLPLDGVIDGAGITVNGIIDDADGDGILDNFDTDDTVFGSPRDLDKKLALYFDGRNDYIEEDSGTDIVNGLGEATMMAWVKLDPTFSKHGAIMGQTNFWIRINGSRRLRVEIPDTHPFTTPAATALSLNKWTHVAVVYDGLNSLEKVKLYINGEKIASINPAGLGSNIPTSANTKFRIGRAPSNTDIYNTTSDMFKGELDEIRVFNKALSDDELQKMVYQEIDDSNGFNRGTIIPLDITPTIGANLLRYYKMDVYKDDILDDLTTPSIDVLTGAKLYNIKNMYPQTAPLPYETTADGDWSDSANWVYGDVWDISSELTNKDWSIVHVKNNITTSNNHTNTGLIIDDNKELSIQTSKELKNTWYLLLNGVIDLEDESQLVQTIGSVLDGSSLGFIERDQQGEGNRYRYNYWSMPVYTLNDIDGNYTTVSASLKDGTVPSNPGTITFNNSGYDGAQTTPITLSSYWMYKYVNSGLGYSAWNQIRSTGKVYVGQGFTMKGSSAPGSPEQNYVFVGKPNNGTINLFVSANNDYLVGNPYPSAIDAKQFINDNATSITGSIYFWEHFGGDTHNLSGYQAGYATYSLGGGVQASAFPGLGGGISVKGAPKQYIPVGQAFFVVGDADGGDIQLNNGQRVFVKEGATSVFMKSSNIKAKNTDIQVKDLRPKFRIGFDAPKINHRQLLLTIDEKATNDVDWGYDAEIYEIFEDDMFWMLEGKKYVIQATNSIGLDTEISVGIQLSKAGIVMVKIDELENVDENTTVFLKDKLTGEIYNMTSKPVKLNLVAGIYSDRFVLTFKNQKLISEDVVSGMVLVEEQLINEGILVFMNNSISELQIKNNSNDEIINIVLYNYLGQITYNWNTNLNKRTISLPMNIPTGVYIVKINTANGDVVKKIIKD